MNTAHLGDCLNGCDTCKENYHADFKNIDCDTCGQFIEGAPICNNCGQYETHATDQDCPAFNYDFGVLNGVLTLAQFRKFTEHLSGHYQIVISDLDRNFLNVNLVSLPDDDETHVINLLTANTFDPRQI